MTKVYWTVAVVTTILSSIGAMNAMWLYLDFDLVFKKFQIWRLLTNFIFFGNFSMPFIFQVVLLSVENTQNCRTDGGSMGFASAACCCSLRWFEFCCLLLLLCSSACVTSACLRRSSVVT